MDWSEERFIKVYTRDTTNWLSLSWQARGLFVLILRKLNRAGVLDLGRLGAKGVAVHVEGSAAAWPSIEPYLTELLDDGCVAIEGATLRVPNFVEAQAATQSPAARKRAERERAEVTKRDGESRNVTDSHGESRDVTGGHAASRGVTTRLDETRTDETRETRASAEPTPSAHGPATTPTGRSLLDAFRDAAGNRATLIGNMSEERGLADMLARLAPTAAEVVAMGAALADSATWWPPGKRAAPKHITLRDLAGWKGADGSPEWAPLSALIAHVRAKATPPTAARPADPAPVFVQLGRNIRPLHRGA